MKPCCCPGAPNFIGSTPPFGPPSVAVWPLAAPAYEVMHCTGFAMVYSPGCRPAFQILGINGCPQDGEPSTALFIANIQIVMLRLTSRDLVTCCRTPLASVTPFTLPGGCGAT
jgi:hypothetical protein